MTIVVVKSNFNNLNWHQRNFVLKKNSTELRFDLLPGDTSSSNTNVGGFVSTGLWCSATFLLG